MSRLGGSALLVVAALVAALGALAADLATDRERRLDDLDRDFRAAASIVSGEIGSAHDAVRAVGADPAIRAAALNGRTPFFDEALRALRARYPEMRALTATAGYDRFVRAGEPELSALLEDVYDSPLCLRDRVYTVLWAPIGTRGVLGVAYDPGPALERARAATAGRARLSLLEQLTTKTLAVEGVPACGELPEEPLYLRAANGERALRFDGAVDGPVAYAPLRGTILELLVEEQPSELAAAALRRGALAALALASALALVIRRARMRRGPRAG